MSHLFLIKDDRTKFCRSAMKANGGQWNAQLNAWMFLNADDHADAVADLYAATRPTSKMCEALQEMIADGIGALAWNFDPKRTRIIVEQLDRARASKMLSAGYAVRRMLGIKPPTPEYDEDLAAELDAA